jgi:hypothetical protein
MTHALAKKNDHQISPWEARANETERAVFEGDLLKFKKGQWYRGEGSKPVENGTRVICNMAAFWTGWIRWFNMKPVEHRGGCLVDFPQHLTRDDLGHNDKSVWETDPKGNPKDPWSPTDMLVMRELDSGDLVTYSTSSDGGRDALGKLCRAFDRNYRKHVGEFPVVELGAESYEHHQHGTTWKPTLKIVGWAKWGDNENGVGGGADGPTQDDPRTLVAQDLDDEIPF